MSANYDDWTREQAARVAGELRRHAMAGHFNVKAYVTAADGPRWGFLTVAEECPPGASGAVRFPLYGGTERLAGIPYSALPSAIWQACRELPVIGR